MRKVSGSIPVVIQLCFIVYFFLLGPEEAHM